MAKQTQTILKMSKRKRSEAPQFHQSDWFELKCYK